MGSGPLIISFIVIVVLIVAVVLVLFQYRSALRSAKNYERGLKMVPLLIHLPPSSEDIEAGSRDKRDLAEEIISQAQVMYSIISSTATKGFKSKIYGQKHISFEIIAHEGLVRYYVVVPISLIEMIKQAVASAYPSARLEEVRDINIFNRDGKSSGTIGGEFSLKKSFIFPIATYQESKRDAASAILNAFSSAKKEDGIGLQLLIRPAKQGWSKASETHISNLKKGKSQKKTGFMGFDASGFSPGDIMEALWKPPEAGKDKEPPKPEDTQLTALEQAEVDAISEKARYPAYEVLVRVVVSSSTATRSQVLLNNIVSSFALFDSARNNGFKFAMTRNVDDMVTAYLMRFFPQETNSNILNSIEMATVFHLPSTESIPTSQVKRQMSKQVDGPTDVMDEGMLIGYNEFRGVKKPIRLKPKDRNRHVYIIGQTGTGKSWLQENMAYQDMMDGRGFAMVDPHGDLVEALLGEVPKERVEDIIYFNPADMDNPIGLNMFEFNTPEQKDFLIQEAINMLYSLYDPGHTGIVGPRLEHIFRNCALLLMSDPAGGTFIDVPKCLIDPEFVKAKLKYVTDPQVLDFWTKEFPASQRSNEAGEVIAWVVSKFGPFISNDAMRNIIGQTKSGFNLREIMDNKKILLVNLSKGRMGELNAKLLGIIFIMKFQAAAMSRADIPEDERVDFSLYVDEFQNFATDSFESIMSEARKYKLSLIMGNQFMTQLTDKIREAIIGNVGTVISGRIGVTDAELMVKKFQPTFDMDDLTKLPNFQSITSVMINNVPSAPFSMNWVPRMGTVNPQLRDALIRLSKAKYGKPRAQVEKEIFERMGRDQQLPAGGANASIPASIPKPPALSPGGGGSFLDEWLAKRQQLGGAKPGSPAPAPPQPTPTTSVTTPGVGSSQPLSVSPPYQPSLTMPTTQSRPTVTPFSSPSAPPVSPATSAGFASPMTITQPVAPLPQSSRAEEQPLSAPTQPLATVEPLPVTQTPGVNDNYLGLRGDKATPDSEVSISLR